MAQSFTVQDQGLWEKILAVIKASTGTTLENVQIIRFSPTGAPVREARPASLDITRGAASEEQPKPAAQSPSGDCPALSETKLVFATPDEFLASLNWKFESDSAWGSFECPESDRKRLLDWMGGKNIKSIKVDPKETEDSATEAVTRVKLGKKDASVVQIYLPEKVRENATTYAVMVLRRLGFNVELAESVGKLTRAECKAAVYFRLALSDVVEGTYEGAMKCPEFLPELLGKEITAPDISEFTKCPLDIPVIYACLLLEMFCDASSPHSQAITEFCFFNKKFMTMKCIYDLSLLPPLPVAFEVVMETGQARLTFADTNVLPAEKIRAQVDLAIKIFSLVRPARASFAKVDLNAIGLPHFQRLSSETGIALLKAASQENMHSTSTTVLEGSFEVMALPVIDGMSGSDARALLKERLEKLFEQCQEWKCDVCKAMYSGLKNKQAECVQYEHPGNKIPFPDGKMVHTTDGGDGTEIVIENWSCCGECPEDYEGCAEVPFEAHSTSEPSPSVFAFGVA